MRARHRTERQNQRDECRARSNRVGEQRNRHVAAGEALAHDARAHHRGYQKTCAEEFGYDAAAESWSHSWPMRSTSLLMASEARLASGKHRNRLMRRLSVWNASRKARSISAGVPTTAAGSGTP